MNSRKFKSSYFVVFIFVASLLLLVFISSVSYRHSVNLAKTSELIVHSYTVDLDLEQLLSYLKDAETGQRGYLVTHDTTFLQPYNDVLNIIKIPFLHLKSLTSNNLAEQKKLNTIAELINERMELLRVSIDIDSLALDKKLLAENMIKGKNVMDTLRSKINELINLETISLSEEQNKYKHEVTFTPIFTFNLFLFSLTVLIISFLKINKDLVTQKMKNENLLITTESFKQAEEIGDFSNWQWDIDKNKITYSDNQFRLLGYDPQSFDPDKVNFLEFVHPDDWHILNEVVKVAKEENKGSNAFFRIIRKDLKLRYLKSVSKITYVQGKRILIGINVDVTEQYLSNIELEERNKDLERTNKELASFNHIASHDLQEPLRKIGTYISRISEKEIITLTDKGNEYFERILHLADGMRILINDLLLYSRSNKADKIFEKMDLNILLESARLELAHDIEEKEGVINTTELPVLKVIPFQIKQLFINLISNSLKYSKPGIPPIITIDCEKVISNDSQLFNANIKKKYYKISISDNGIGFEQKYSEKIFILFNRLQQKNEFPGSGIGLSICRRIVENHNGYILAQGKPGVGATFNMFFPE